MFTEVGCGRHSLGSRKAAATRSAWFNLLGWLVAHGLWAESATSRKLSGGKGQRVVISTQQTCHAAADQYTRGPSGYEHLASTTPNCSGTAC